MNFKSNFCILAKEKDYNDCKSFYFFKYLHLIRTGLTLYRTRFKTLKK